MVWVFVALAITVIAVAERARCVRRSNRWRRQAERYALEYQTENERGRAARQRALV